MALTSFTIRHIFTAQAQHMKRRIFKDLASYFDETNDTQAAFAERLKVTQGCISLIRNGKRTPSMKLAQRIAAEACIPLESLISADG
jgi:DNA-binding XRE family transcriptional regulator